MAGKPSVIKGWELLCKQRPWLYLRQDLRAPRKSRVRRQFLNSLRSNRRNCHPPYPVFASCGPSCSNKSLKYNHGHRSLIVHSLYSSGLSLLSCWRLDATPSMDFQRRPAIMPSLALPALGTSRTVRHFTCRRCVTFSSKGPRSGLFLFSGVIKTAIN